MPDNFVYAIRFVTLFGLAIRACKDRPEVLFLDDDEEGALILFNGVILTLPFTEIYIGTFDPLLFIDEDPSEQS